MTTITLEVPDELATRLMPLRAQLPQLLARTLDIADAPEPMTGTLVFDELLNLLAHNPTSQQLSAFKVSPAAQTQLEALLDKQREDVLTADEAAELDVYQWVNHILVLLKARARQALSN